MFLVQVHFLLWYGNFMDLNRQFLGMNFLGTQNMGTEKWEQKSGNRKWEQKVETGKSGNNGSGDKAERIHLYVIKDLVLEC